MNASAAIRVAIVEDNAKYRQCVATWLASTADLQCVAQCPSAPDALKILPGLDPRIVLMDLDLAGKSGIDCISQLRPRLPGAQFLVLTIYEDHARIFASLKAGATGYMLKRATRSELLEAIRSLHAGESPISGPIARKLVAAFQTPPSASQRPVDSPLSPTEWTVLNRLSRGLLYKEIASELQISMCTVRTHVNHIYTKLHVHNRTEAVLKGIQHASVQPLSL